MHALQTQTASTTSQGSAPSAATAADHTAAEAQSAELSGGLPYQGAMEAAFGESFSGVRAQVGAASELAGLGARAAALPGEQLMFASAQPTPTQVAHELTHVVQTRRHGTQGALGSVSQPGDAAEQEARAVATRAAAGGSVGPGARPSAQIQLDAEPEVTPWVQADQVRRALLTRKVADACALFAGQTPARIAWVRKDYRERTSWILEQHASMLLGGEYPALRDVLWPGIECAWKEMASYDRAALIYSTLTWKDGEIALRMVNSLDAYWRDQLRVDFQSYAGEPLENRFFSHAPSHHQAAVDALWDSIDAPFAAMDRAARVKHIQANLHAWVTNDAWSAWFALKEVSTDELMEIRTAYKAAQATVLEKDFIDIAPTAVTKLLLARLWPRLSLVERLDTQVFGWTENEQGMLEIIANASNAERFHARTQDKDALFAHVDLMNADEEFEARTLIYPEPNMLIDHVERRVARAAGMFNDDEGAVHDAILQLSPAQRVVFWHGADRSLPFLNTDEKAAIKRMCVKVEATDEHGHETYGVITEAEAMHARLKLATDGKGTDDTGVQVLTRKVAQLVQEEDALVAIPEAQRTPEQTRRLAELGSVRASLLTVERIESNGVETDDLTADSFLGILQADEEYDATFHGHLQTMGVDPYQIAKQKILDAHHSSLSTDEDAIFAAIADVQAPVTAPAEGEERSQQDAHALQEAANRDMRARLRGDPDLAPIFRSLSKSDRQIVSAHLNSDPIEIAVQRLREAYEGVSIDYQAMFRVICGLNAERRGQLKAHTYFTGTLQKSWFMSSAAQALLTAAIDDGKLPTDDALDFAFGGSADGTDEALVEQIFIQLDPAERRAFRTGYWLHRSGARADSLVGAEKQAFERFVALEKRMTGELKATEVDSTLDVLLGTPDPEDLLTSDGRRLALRIMRQRQEDKLALQGGFADHLTETDGTVDTADVAFKARYDAIMAQPEISGDDFAVLAGLDSKFQRRFAEYTGSVEFISDLAGTVAAVAAGVIITLASGGTLGPVAAALCAAAGGAAAKVSFAELAGGDFHDALGADGGMNAMVGAIDGAMAVLAAGLAAKGTEMVGLGGRALAQQITRTAITAGERSMGTLGRAFARGGVEGLIDGAVSGAVGEAVMTLADAQAWKQSVWQMICDVGLSLLRGGAIGAATGGIFGGTMEAAGAYLKLLKIKSIPIEQVDDLGAKGKVVYAEADGVVTDVKIQLGPKMTLGDIHAHVEIAVMLKSYSPLRRRIGKLLGKGPRQFDEASEAGLEITKIKEMMADRLDRLAKGDLTPDEVAQIKRELEGFEAAIAKFEHVRLNRRGVQGKGEINSPELEGFGKTTHSDDGIIFGVEGSGVRTLDVRADDLSLEVAASDDILAEIQATAKTDDMVKTRAYLEDRFNQGRFEAMKSSAEKTADGDVPLFFRSVSKEELGELLTTGQMSPSGFSGGPQTGLTKETLLDSLDSVKMSQPHLSTVSMSAAERDALAEQLLEVMQLEAGAQRSARLIEVLGTDRVAALHNESVSWFAEISPVKSVSLGPEYDPAANEFYVVIVDTNNRAYRNHEDLCGEGEWLFGGAIGEDEVALVLTPQQYTDLYGSPSRH